MADHGVGASRASRKLSRRDWLMAGGGGLAAAAIGKTVLDPASAAGDVVPTKYVGDPLGASICGTLKGLRDGAVLVLEDCYPGDSPLPGGARVSSGSEQELAVGADAKLWRDGPVGLDGFKVGDKLIAYVRTSGSVLEAWGIEPIFEPVSTVVTSRRGNALQTPLGTILLSQHTLVRLPSPGAMKMGRLDDIQAGHRIGATCLRDPDTGSYLAQNVSVVV
jgi:hypothetical protein